VTSRIAYPKRLIEVDLPIKRISEHARREKSIRHGHISTLHIWWARRPLAACRAVICAALWPDPADPHCPQEFRNRAARIINEFARKAASDKELAAHCSHESWVKWQKLSNSGGLDSTKEAHWNVLRFALLDFIADFANWDNSTVAEYLETSHALTEAAHEALGGAPGTRPLVVDPFAGGGSIPLEALRVGADAFASDLNPVAVLLNKVVLEYIPRYGQRLADEVRKWGEWVQREAEMKLVQFYPNDDNGATPIAYLWARTILCEGPGCGVEVPILPSRLLEKKGDRSTWISLKGKDRSVTISIQHGSIDDLDVKGTAKRGSVTCPCCGYTTPITSVREQLKRNGGGVKKARLLAVALFDNKKQVRGYRLPNESDYRALAKAAKTIAELRKTDPNAFPDETLPLMSGVFNVPLYGHNTWSSLYSDRQLLLLVTLCQLAKQVGEKLRSEKDIGLAAATATMLSIAIGKVADYSTSICTWVQSGGFVGHTFAQGQCLPMKFDFAESVPLAGFSGSWEGAIDWGCRIIERESGAIQNVGHVECVSATVQSLPDDAASCLVTDPPYYNAVPYADLSDFFYVWHRRTLCTLHADLFRLNEAPKAEEICEMSGWDPVRYGNKTSVFFENEIGKAFAESRRVVSPTGIGVIVFAHKTTSGWESLLQAIVDSGWVVTGSWPVDTERASRLRAMESAALASSVHLVCRPREKPNDSVQENEIGDWRDVLQELPERIHEWMPRMAAEGVVGADAIFACLGPALEIFSRYGRVEKASGEKVTLKEYLEYVWAAVSKEALAMIFTGADTTGFEEDSRLTAMWLWTLSTGSEEDGATRESKEDESEGDSAKKSKMTGFVLEYDAARKIAQGLGAHLTQLESLVEINGDQARLLPVSERARHLFGKAEGATPTKRKGKPKQLSLLDVIGETDEAESGWGEKTGSRIGTTVLDRIHQSMILFAAGRGEAVKRFLVNDGVGQDQRFWRLAQALSALYPKGTDERRWVEGVLARKKGLGF
jgi:putative DNA methylase